MFRLIGTNTNQIDETKKKIRTLCYVHSRYGIEILYLSISIYRDRYEYENKYQKKDGWIVLKMISLSETFKMIKKIIKKRIQNEESKVLTNRSSLDMSAFTNIKTSIQ